MLTLASVRYLKDPATLAVKDKNKINKIRKDFFFFAEIRKAVEHVGLVCVIMRKMNIHLLLRGEIFCNEMDHTKQLRGCLDPEEAFCLHKSGI